MKRAPFTPQSPEDFERVTLGIHETSVAIIAPSESDPATLATPAAVRFAITTNLVAANAPILKQRVVEALARGSLHFVVDLAHCRYVDSRGLGVLVSVANQARRAGGSLTIANAKRGSDDALRAHGLRSAVHDFKQWQFLRYHLSTERVTHMATTSAGRTVTVNHRDLTKALMIAKALDGALGSERLEDHRTETHELVRLLGAFDLRTGRNDPTQRHPKRSAKKSAKRPAKKVRARR